MTNEEAIDRAIVALRSTTWIRTGDMLPNEDDGYVVGLREGPVTGELIPVVMWFSSVSKTMTPYWLPLPKLPEVGV